jgi:hypothetical protein
MAQILKGTDKGFIPTRATWMEWVKAGTDQSLSVFDKANVPVQLKWNPQSDMHGMMLQVDLSTKMIQETMQQLERVRGEGFQVCYWVNGDMVPMDAYIARVAWDTSLTSRDFLERYLDRVAGSEAVGEGLQAFAAIEEATRFARNEIWAGFPFPDLLLRHFREGRQGKPEDQYEQRRDLYKKAMPHLRRAHQLATAQGKEFLDYYIQRAESSIHFLESAIRVRRAGKAYAEVEKNRVERDGKKIFTGYREVGQLLDEAHRHIVKAAESQARIVRDQSDLGNLAVANLFGIDYVKSLRHLIWLETNIWYLW